MSNENENKEVYESDIDEIDDLDIDAIEEKAITLENRKKFEKSLQTMWGYSSAGAESHSAAMSMLSTKTGMYARIPLTCKAEGCPYSETCRLLKYNLAPKGEPCPVETAQIELSLNGYDKDFDFDEASFTDKNLIISLINHDVMLERIKALLQKEDGCPVEEVFAGVSEQGEEFTKPEISKNWEAYERVEKKRNEIYSLLLATRKDKKGINDQGSNTFQDIINTVMVGQSEFKEEAIPEQFIDINENE